MPGRRHVIITAPSTLGLASSGVEELPRRLLELGLAERIGAQRIQHVPVASKEAERDRETLVLSARSMAAWSPRLADAVEAVVAAREFPVVLGGDCTIVLGSMLALRRRGRYGLMFIDGNADYFQPQAEPNGEGASMDLAFVTGRGPSLLTNLEGLAPLVRPEDTVAFGFRDLDDQAQYGSQPLPPELLACDLEAVRQLGVEVASRKALEHLTRPELDGFFIHVDADCLDDAVMPAVDFRVPGGFSWDELGSVLGILLASDRAAGLEVTIYNPRLDTDGSAGRGLAEVLASVLSRSSSTPE
jgi:arginase